MLYTHLQYQGLADSILMRISLMLNSMCIGMQWMCVGMHACVYLCMQLYVRQQSMHPVKLTPDFVVAGEYSYKVAMCWMRWSGAGPLPLTRQAP
jgi:hypothetical protein